MEINSISHIFFITNQGNDYRFLTRLFIILKPIAILGVIFLSIRNVLVILFILGLVVLVSGCTSPNSANNTTTSSKLKDSIDGRLNITLENYSSLKNDSEFKKLASNTIYNKLTPYGSTDKEVLNITFTSVSDSRVEVKVQAYDTVTKENYNLEITFNKNNGRWSVDETTGNKGSWT